MDGEISKMGRVLRRLGGGFVQIMMRHSDLGMRHVVEPQTKQPMGAIGGQELVGIEADSYVETEDPDVWAFTTTIVGESGPERYRIFVDGKDILYVRAKETR